MANASIVELLSKAPVNQRYEDKMAFYCGHCPWWASDAAKAGQGEGGVLRCPRCAVSLKPMPLEAFLELHRNDLSQAKFEVFLSCKDDGAYWVDK